MEQAFITAAVVATLPLTLTLAFILGGALIGRATGRSAHDLPDTFVFYLFGAALVLVAGAVVTLVSPMPTSWAVASLVTLAVLTGGYLAMTPWRA